MEITKLLNVFIVCDIIFICSFSISGLEEYSKNFLVIGVILVSLLSYYPLYLYVKEQESTVLVVKDKLWHYNHQSVCTVYSLCRGATLALFLALAVVHTNDFDLWETFNNFSFLTNIALLSMTATFVVLVAVASYVSPYHRGLVVDNINNVNINATIVYSKTAQASPPIQTYNTVSALEFSTAQRIWLTPDQTQQDHTFLVTKFAQQDLYSNAIPMTSR